MDTDLLSQVEVFLSTGDREKAQELIKKYLRQNPRDESAWILLARTVDTTDQAVYCLQQAFKINPDNPQAEALLETIVESEVASMHQNEEVSSSISDLEVSTLSVGSSTPVDEEEKPSEISKMVSSRVEVLSTVIREEIEPGSPPEAVDQGEVDKSEDEAESDRELISQNLQESPTYLADYRWNWRCNTDGLYTYCSSEVAIALRIPPGEFLGRKLEVFALAEKSRLAISYHLQEDLLPVDLPVHFINIDHQLIPVSLHIERIEANGKKVGYQGIATVISLGIDSSPIKDEKSFRESHNINQDSVGANPRQEKETCPHLENAKHTRDSSVPVQLIRVCNRPVSPLPVGEAFLQKICTTTAYKHCQVYQKGLKWPLPSIISQESLIEARQRRWWILIGSLGLALLIVLGVFGIFILLTG